MKKVPFQIAIILDPATPWTAAYQAPLSIGFSRQEYWSELPLPFPSEEMTAILFPGSSVKSLNILFGSPDVQQRKSPTNAQMQAVTYPIKKKKNV